MRGELPLHLHFKVFDQQIRPIIGYASDIWCQKMPIEALETTQLKYLKKNVRGLPINANSGGIWGDRTVPTATATGRQHDTILGANTTPSTHTLFTQDRKILLFHDQGHDTWAGRVKAIFAKYSITDENLEHTTSSELDIFLRKFHEVRYEQYQRKLISDIKDDNKKLTVYKLIKNDYRIEPHLIFK